MINLQKRHLKLLFGALDTTSNYNEVSKALTESLMSSIPILLHEMIRPYPKASSQN